MYFRSLDAMRTNHKSSGMGLILEHRYYGTSFPEQALVTSSGLTTDNLRWLTTDQSIADIAYFAQHVSIPGHENENLTAPGRPWILSMLVPLRVGDVPDLLIDGGSLAGAEVAFTMKEYGDVIYGAISSSGTVQAFKGYPEWCVVIPYYSVAGKLKLVKGTTQLRRTPRRIVFAALKTLWISAQTLSSLLFPNHQLPRMDSLIATNNTGALTELKTLFGLEALQDIRDFALTIAVCAFSRTFKSRYVLTTARSVPHWRMFMPS
jgi:hypothetical protein